MAPCVHKWHAMIYLDYQATTPLAPEARDAMLRWLDGPEGTGFGNPHSPHRMGRQAAAAIEVARDQIAARQACRFDIVAISPYHWPQHIENAFYGDG